MNPEGRSDMQGCECVLSNLSCNTHTHVRQADYSDDDMNKTHTHTEGTQPALALVLSSIYLSLLFKRYTVVLCVCACL